MVTDSTQAIVVFTADTVEEILEQRGSGDWVVSAGKASQCKYIVCCRKLSWKNRTGGASNRAAFLIGRICGLQKRRDSENDRGQTRFLIEFSEYALLNKPDVWNKNARNPIAYHALGELGMDLRDVEFQALPPSPAQPPLPMPTLKMPRQTGNTMTIAEAKKALAASFGVSPEDIEIIIRG